MDKLVQHPIPISFSHSHQHRRHPVNPLSLKSPGESTATRPQPCRRRPQLLKRHSHRPAHTHGLTASPSPPLIAPILPPPCA